MSKDANRKHNKKPKLGGVNKVEKQLYAKNTKIKDYRRLGFKKNNTEQVATSWDEPQEEKEIDLIEKKKKKNKTKKSMTTFTKVLLSSVLFFIFSIIAAVLVFVLQANEVNYDAVNLAVRGPNTVAAGEEIVFDVNVSNNNPVDVVLTDIVVNYPSGTISADEGLPLEKDIVSIEEIRSGLNESAKFKAILFGSENDMKDIGIVFQYRVPGSDTIFFKERVYKVQLESAPVVINAQHEDNFQSGDEVEINIELLSNAAKPLRNLFLSVDYPFGFEFASSTPSGIDPQSYRIGTLEPGEKKTVTVSGTIRGQDDEQRTIRYSLGSESSNQEGTMGTVFALNQSILNIARPPIALDIGIEEQSGSVYIAQPAQELQFILEYANNLTTKLLDTELGVEFSGEGFDRSSVRTDTGYYRSANNTISWAQNNISGLGEIESNQGGSTAFELTTMSSQELTGLIENPEFLVRYTAQATNFELGGAEKRVSHEVVQKIKIETTPEVNAYLLYTEGPFDNSGPMQPRVEETTTYTLVLEALNTTNTLDQVEVQATLPPYVSLREQLEPSSAQVDFDQRNRTVSWSINELKPGVGYTQQAKTLYLSLGFEPSLNQVGQSPKIVENITISGHDTFTDTQISNDDQNDLTTNLRRDTGFDANPRVIE